MRKLFYACLMAMLCFSTRVTAQNNHIFPAAAAARPYINFDARGFLINGNRTFICSGGLEYARMPRELWADRLMRLKMAGYNCVEMYTFWNYHEPVEGQFNFSGDHDLDAFLKLVKKMGMYAIVRVGPFSGAEWNYCGLPIWLSFKNNVLTREPNAAFEHYADAFFDKLIPIVSNNQINKGGAVIMVQLENEHPAGWGTDVPNSYFAHLQSKVLSLGLQVPYFFSGLNHSADPAANKVSLDDGTRPNPWMTTEFWTINAHDYGETEAQVKDYDRRNWKIIAHGGNGYNHYMAYGGSNFGYDNNFLDAASYDFGSPVGQAGDLRPLYYCFKKAALFARSFPEILENSHDATPQFSNVVSDTAVKVTARQSPAGTILFLDNPGTSAQQTQVTVNGQKLPTNCQLKLQPQDILPVVCNYQLAQGVKIDVGLSRILGISRQGKVTTLVTYGAPNDVAQLIFSSKTKFQPTANNRAFTFAGKKMFLSYKFPSDQPATYVFKNGTETIRVIALSNTLAERTWFADADGVNFVITGPEYVSELNYANNVVTLKTEHAWQQTRQFPTWIWIEDKSLNLPLKTSTGNHTDTLPLTNTWQVKNASLQAGINFDDSKWLKSDTAQLIGADNDITCDAWHRTQMNVQQAGTYLLKNTKGTGRATVFIDGNRVASGNIGSKAFQFPLTAGNHTLAVFAAHDGRDTRFQFTGNLQNEDPKGLGGKVTLVNTHSGNGTNDIVLKNWSMKGGPGDYSPPAGWSDLTATTSEGRPAFYKNSFTVDLTDSISKPMYRVISAGLGHGNVWVNGHNLGRYPEKININGLYIPECWLVNGANSLVIYDEDGALPTKVSVQAEVAASRDVATVTYKLK